jgi:rfaE bifunctional protein kinase chain/domain
MDTKKIKNLLNKIKSSKPKILVLGDVMIDSYVYGDVKRISPEAPVPIIDVEKKIDRLGGAGNVVLNLQNLGVEVNLATIIGSDFNGGLFERLLKKNNLSTQFVLKSKNVNTTKKTRFLSGSYQLLRMDNDSKGFKKRDTVLLERKIIPMITYYDAIIISDYNKGVCSEFLIKKVIVSANKEGASTFIDPKGDKWDKYLNATCLTPNTTEIEGELKQSLNTDAEFKKAAVALNEKYKLDYSLITRGANGMTYCDGHTVHHQKVGKKEVYDVSGAGDTVIACFAASMSSKIGLSNALKLSSFIASEVVAHIGTMPFNEEMLKVYNA